MFNEDKVMWTSPELLPFGRQCGASDSGPLRDKVVTKTSEEKAAMPATWIGLEESVHRRGNLHSPPKVQRITGHYKKEED